MWRRFLALLGLRRRFRVEDLGSGWQLGRFAGDPACEPFRFLYQEMDWRDRIELAGIEDARAQDGKAQAEQRAQEIEPEIIARHVRLPGDGGGMEPPTAEEVLALGGQSASAYVALRRAVLAPYYRELVEGDRKKKVWRRWRSTRSVLTSLLARAESV